MLLFLVLKTGRGLVIAAALARPAKLVDLDACVMGDLRFSLASRSKRVSKVRFAKQSAMRLVFNGKEKLSKYSENPVTRFSWQRFDGNVEVVT